MSSPRHTRPTPPSVIAFRQREGRKAPAIIFAQDLTRPPPEPEPTYAAELRWTAGWMLAGVLLPMLLVAVLYGPAVVWRALWAAVAGLPL